jgi:hypothetical protein
MLILKSDSSDKDDNPDLDFDNLKEEDETNVDLDRLCEEEDEPNLNFDRLCEEEDEPNLKFDRLCEEEDGPNLNFDRLYTRGLQVKIIVTLHIGFGGLLA